MNNHHGLILLSLLGLGAIASISLMGAGQRPHPVSSSVRSHELNRTQKETNAETVQTQPLSMSPDQLAQIEQTLDIPPGFTLVAHQPATVDGEAAWHLRYEREDGQNRGLHGEHFSAVISQADGRIQGVTHMNATPSNRPLPSKEQAQETAIAYLQKNAPDLLNAMEIQWIEPHDEYIQVRGEMGEPQIVPVTGMKVKCYNTADGRYFWVIVGPQEQVITFERDIVWSTNMGQRQTEKWLHDQWLAQQQTTADL